MAGKRFTAQAVRDWLQAVGVRTLYIEPGSPWENGYIESFSGMVELATNGRYGYRRVTAILHGEGWKVNSKRVERLWRQEGLKASRQPKRRRLWFNDGSCVRFRKNTFGAMISCMNGPMMGEPFGY